MAMFAPKVAVQPPARQQLPFGLFSVFQAQTSADRWLAGGVAWEALTDAGVVGLPVGISEQTGENTHDFSTGREVAGEAKPFTIFGYFEDTLATASEADARAKAEEHLLLHEQRRVEQAFWTGDLGNYPNLAGANDPGQYPAPSDLGSFPFEEALAELEGYLGDVLGYQGVIHVPRHLASRLTSQGMIEAKGGRMFTKLETPVVVGSGYSGDRMIVSPPVFGFRSEVETWVTADIQRNNRLATASRDYVLGFDPSGLAEVTVALETSDGNGTSGPSEVTIIGTSGTLPVSVEGTSDVNVTNTAVPVSVEGSVDSNITNDTLPVSGSVSVSGTSDVNVTNEVLNVEIVPEETPDPEA